MAQQSFNSFKELLLKKNLSGEDGRQVHYDTLSNIFRFVQPNIIENTIKDFDDKECSIFKELLKKPELQSNSEAKLSNGEYEALVRDACKDVADSSKLKLIDLLEKEVKQAQKEAKKLEKISRSIKTEDPAEEKADLENRIKDLQRDIIDIEMNLMSMESNEQQNTERYKKAYNAREKRKVIIGKCEKQLQFVLKKLEKNSKAQA